MSAIENQDRPIQSEADGDDPLLGEFKRLQDEIRDGERSRSKWKEEANRCFDYVAGHQWDPEDKQKLDEQHRPAVVFNRISPLVKAVGGLEVNNRQELVFLGRGEEDQGINEMITAAGKWVRDECHAEDEESEAFRDLTICGEGWTEQRMDFDEDPKGKIVKERIDPTEMGVNKGASRANYVDARMVYRIRDMDPNDVRALLGLTDDVDAADFLEDAALDASWLDATVPEDGGKGNKKDYPKQTRAAVRGRRGLTKLKTVRIIQCQYWKREPVNMVATANDSEPVQMNDEEFATFQNRAAQSMLTMEPIQYDSARITKKVYYECFIGVRILGEIKRMPFDTFQFKAMTGERDRKNKCFYGMVRDMLDPQMWSNKFLSQTMHHINVNAKGGLMAERSAFENVRNAERDWSDPTKIVWLKDGALTKQRVKERTSIALPPGLDQLMMFAISSIRDVSGINLELLGQADREQAASLEQQRRQSAMTILATMFDSLRRYRKHDGYLTLQFIKMLPEGTLIRVVDQGEYRYIPLVKSGVDFEKFDTIIDQAPTSPDQKQFVWAITAQILQMGILPPPAIVALLKYSPYPEKVVMEIRSALGLDGEMPPDQLKQRLQQAEEALQQLELELKSAIEKAKTAEDDREVELLNVKIDAYKAETERLRAQWEARIKAATAVAQRADAAEARDDQMVNAEAERGVKRDTAAMGAMSRVVNTGEQQLPDAGSGQAASPGIEQKLDALAAMVAQLVQAISGGQAPPAGPPEEPQEIAQGEM